MDIDFKVGNVYERIEKMVDSDNRYICLRGGSSSGKSISVLQYLVIYALQNKNKTINIITESMVKAKRSLIPDLQNIVMKDLWANIEFNKTESIITFPTGTVMRFISAEDPKKVVGLRSDILYADEVDTINEEVMNQLSIRTRGKIIFSFNPRNKFPYYESIEHRKDFVEDISTYLDNPFLEPEIITDLLERAKLSLNFKMVYVEGNWGSTEGLVFQEDIGDGGDWQLIDELPTESDKEYFALDFGFRHKTAIVHVKVINKSVYINEEYYESDKINSEIAKEIERCNPHNYKIVCDSAEPRAIAELSRTYGIAAKGIKKLEVLDSINNWKEQTVFITKSSTNLIKELRTWEYEKKKTDKKGRPIPVNVFDDLIAASRYGIDDNFKPVNKKQIRIIKI